MTKIRLALVAVLAMFSMSLFTTPARAQSEMSFAIKSNHPNKVHVAFYSADRKGFVWPGVNRAYNLDDYEVKTMKISCLGGEKICYGAWVVGGTTHWGVGQGNTQRCQNCCYTCNGGTANITLGR